MTVRAVWTMPRFAIAHHTGGEAADHFDLFLEVEAALKTWRVAKPDFAEPQPATAIQDHRLKYLDYEGEISGGRGRVTLWDRGAYAVDAWEGDRVQVALAGAKLKTRLRLEKSGDAWRVFDPTRAVRGLAAELMRGEPLDLAPDPALEPVREALAREERLLMAVVDRFTRGAPIAWPVEGTDGAVRERLQKALAQWKHPWLARAAALAAALDALLRALR